MGACVGALEAAQWRAKLHAEQARGEGAEVDGRGMAGAGAGEMPGVRIEHRQKRGHMRLIGIEPQQQFVGLAQDEGR